MRSASDEGFSIMSLPPGINGDETIEFIQNSTKTFNNVGILFNADCPGSNSILSTVKTTAIFIVPTMNEILINFSA